MRANALLIFFLLVVPILTIGQNQITLQEKLGYETNAKLLIIHGDDLAVAHSENQATFSAMENGSVNSASIMAPCPWLPEVADYVKQHPDHDLGMHLTLTSEWNYYKWGPVAPRGEVSSLVNDYGYLHDNCADLAKKADLEEVEKELRAQIEQAKAMGIEPTHLDSHMGCLFFQSPQLFEIYLKLGREYSIPTMVTRNILTMMPEAFQQKVTDRDILIDAAFMANPPDFQKGMREYYTGILRNLEPGVSIIIIHTAFDNDEMRGVSIDHPDWGAAWRQADYDFFSSRECKQILEEEGIQLVTWREIGRLIKD